MFIRESVSSWRPRRPGRGRSVTRRTRSKLQIGFCLLVCVAPGYVAAAQSTGDSWEAKAGGKMSFDAASVKPNKSGLPYGDRPYFNVPLDAADSYSPTGGLFSATNIPLGIYIAFAYKYQFSPGTPQSWPKSVMTEDFDIQARGPASATKDQMRLMMQSLLAERFKLAVHWDTREIPALSLMLAKPGKMGPELRPHSNQPPCVEYAAGMSTAQQMATGPEGLPALCGRMVGSAGRGGEQSGGRNITMQQLADYISRDGTMQFNKPVIDKTGLNGTFDLKLEYTIDSSGGPVQQGDFQAGFIEALQDQLGLKLESSTDQVKILAVDHVEELSPN